MQTLMTKYLFATVCIAAIDQMSKDRYVILILFPETVYGIGWGFAVLFL